jgi:phosphoribosylformimino-5-aminoimidazole carboxamide ribotide isomerase
MVIIPAIDLKGGKCVRLRQGKMDTSTVFSDHPARQARQWEDRGASRIHVVDLEGSIAGRPANFGSVKGIVDSVEIPVQVGGGIRDEMTVRMYLDIGVDAVILGTIAARDPERVADLLSLFPGKLAVGVDARSGMVAVEGWTEATKIPASVVASRFDSAGPVAFIYTDIERDGMMSGPNIAATREFARSLSTPVILSGGISSLSDVEAVLPLEKDGVMGIIIGRALYDGTVELERAIRLTENRDVG